ncbi:MAG: DNA methylase N-4/N-6 [Tepidibacillus sp.]
MILSSILSYPNRGHWGDLNYRGNTSGWIIKGLLEHFKPEKFMEIFAGGGTGFNVARELGYQNSVHLDLNPRWGGWNALRDEVPEGANFVFMHPPYHDIIKYSGEMWGEAHPDDLSRCPTYEDFIKKLDLVHSKVYASLRNGGRMAILIGDVRRKGEYFSIQKDMAWIGDLETHLIKTQHNVQSNHKRYAGKLIPIMHEHLLIFKKNDVWFVSVVVTKKTKQDLRQSDRLTWRDLVQAALEQLGGKSDLDRLYQVIADTKRATNNQHWKDKVRQTLQRYEEFKSLQRGIWQLTFDSNARVA